MDEYWLFVDGASYGPYGTPEASQAQYRQILEFRKKQVEYVEIKSAQLWKNGELLFVIV